ncbi:hypothetical protein C8F04DRAFT_1108703 [Mycena alexandri]|uniref:Uncharacterized protein n=1 Tax=Mycena alexandri TaxID=1745969 RepID=A0AAD6SQ98_9AGAR|nr:hypothetical protein C8F04DRAFT_1108703 [Mycena alexandri]
MHCPTVFVFALFCTSLVAAAPVAPASVSSDVASQSTVATNMAVPIVPGDLLPVAVPEQSETFSHALESTHSAEKSRRRSFRRRHP